MSVARRMGAIAGAVMLMFASATAPLQAQPPSDAVMRGARALFEQGVAAAQSGLWEQAADRFRQAFAQWHSPVIEYNLAKALAELGRLREAAGIFERTQNAADAPENIRVQSRDVLREIEAQLAIVVVRVEGPTTEGTRVQVDDTERTAGAPVRLDPGEHHIVLLRGSEVLDERRVELAAGRTEVTLRVPEPVVAPVVTPAPGSSRPGDSGIASAVAFAPEAGSRQDAAWLSLWPVVATGAGVVLAGVGAVVFLHVNGTKDPAQRQLHDEECATSPAAICGDFSRDWAAADSARDWGLAGMIVGGALAATGAVWWALRSEESREQASLACGAGISGVACVWRR